MRYICYSRYFHEVGYKVNVRYYNSQFFGHGTSKDIQRQFNTAISHLDPNKLLQLEMDARNINVKFFQLIQQDREKN